MSIKYRANDNNLPLSPLPNGYKVKTLFLRFVEEQSGRQLLNIELSLATTRRLVHAACRKYLEATYYVN